MNINITHITNQKLLVSGASGCIVVGHINFSYMYYFVNGFAVPLDSYLESLRSTEEVVLSRTDVLHLWDYLNAEDVRFVELVKPLLEDCRNRKILRYSAPQLDKIFGHLPGLSVRTIQRRLKYLRYAGVFGFDNTFNPDWYTHLLYYSQTIVPYLREANEVYYEGWRVLNDYLKPYNIRVAVQYSYST